MELKLTNDLLLVRRIEDEKPTTDWGFILPPTEENTETPWRGLVLFAGPGRHPKLSPAGKDVCTALRDLLDMYPDKHWEPWCEAEKALDTQSLAPDRIPMQVKVGDKVIFSRHTLQTFRINNEDLLAMQEASILAIISE